MSENSSPSPETCKHAHISLIDYDSLDFRNPIMRLFGIGRRELFNSREKRRNVVLRSGRASYECSDAELECPKTRIYDDQVTVRSEFERVFDRISARSGLVKLAAQTVCKGCVFFELSEDDASQHELQRIQTEKDRLEAIAGLNAAAKSANVIPFKKYK